MHSNTLKKLHVPITNHNDTKTKTNISSDTDSNNVATVKPALKDTSGILIKNILTDNKKKIETDNNNLKSAETIFQINDFSNEKEENTSINENEYLSDISLFKLDSETNDDIKNDYELSESYELNSPESHQAGPDKDDDIQFFEVGSKHVSSFEKAKAVYNSNADDLETKNKNNVTVTDNSNIANRSKTEKPVDTLLDRNDTSKSMSVNNSISSANNNEFVKSPDTSMYYTNGVFINITMVTGFKNYTLDSLPPLYVFSMLIPTYGSNQITLNNHEIREIKHEEEKGKCESKEMPSQPVTVDAGDTYESQVDNSGGTCECSCPCLDNSNESSESSLTSDYEIFELSNTNKQVTVSENPETSSVLDTNPDEEFSTTILSTETTEEPFFPTNCFNQSVPPTILILEGRITLTTAIICLLLNINFEKLCIV